MEIGVQANPPGGTLTVMAPSFPSVPSAQLCLMQQGRGAGSGQRGWLRVAVGGNPPWCPSQLSLQETEEANQMASKAVSLQIVFFNLVSSAFTKDFYRPNWAKMLIFCLLCKAVPLQLNCPVLN